MNNEYYKRLSKRLSILESYIYKHRHVLQESLSCYNASGDTLNYNNDDELQEYLLDNITNELCISDTEFTEILDAINDDSHSQGLDKIVTKIINSGKGEVPKILLYRGCSDFEYNNILNTGTSGINRCLSFSENKSIAKQFGKNLIVAKFEIPIFPYYKLYNYYHCTLKNSLSSEGWREFNNMTDAQYSIDFANNESEWITPKNVKFVKNANDIFTAYLDDHDDTSNLDSVKEHLRLLCKQLKFDDYNLDGYYYGSDSCVINVNPNDYEDELVSSITLNKINQRSYGRQELKIAYKYDKNEISLFAPGIGVIEKEVDIIHMDKKLFCKTIKNMLDSK